VDANDLCSLQGQYINTLGQSRQDIMEVESSCCECTGCFEVHSVMFSSRWGSGVASMQPIEVSGQRS
jgi:hypothetical protein